MEAFDDRSDTKLSGTMTKRLAEVPTAGGLMDWRISASGEDSRKEVSANKGTVIHAKKRRIFIDM